MIETIESKTIISGYAKNSNWFGSNYNMNIYKGCCHGCIYCDSRSDCYRIDHFDNVRVKDRALEIIRDELQRKTRKGVVGTGAMSDPYNPFEKNLKVTRNALELLNAYEYGVAIATKSNLISRDIDILRDISEHSPVLCKMTITTADDQLAKIIEPNVCPSSERFEALSELSKNNIYSGILLMPVLPFITDTNENIREIVKTAHMAGCKFIYPAFGMTLRMNQRHYYYDNLDKYFPGLKLKYQKYYGQSYSCTSPNAKKLWDVFCSECHQYGILYKMHDIIYAYKNRYENRQLTFF